MRLTNHVLLLLLVIPGALRAQVLMPEGELPQLLPTDGGVFVVHVPQSFPIFAVATSATDGGLQHALVWGAQAPKESAEATKLTFFVVPKGGVERLFVANGEVHAENPLVHRQVWPLSLDLWNLSDEGVADGPGSRRFLLMEHNEECPSQHIEHWLEVRNSRLTELLTTRQIGEGGDDGYHDGTVAVWPLADGGVSATSDLLSPSRFPPLGTVGAKQRVVAYEEHVHSGKLRQASRTIYRYGDGGLEFVRVEHLDAGLPAGDP